MTREVKSKSKKILMNCSDLQPHHDMETFHLPANHHESSPKFNPGGRGSDMMYSSLQRTNQLAKVPSAKSISDQLLCPPISSGSDSGPTSDSCVMDGSRVKKIGTRSPREYRVEDNHAAKVRRGRASIELRKNDGGESLLENTLIRGKDGSLSPDTIRIMEEVNNAYLSSPIPASYLNGVDPAHSTLPVISVSRPNESSPGILPSMAAKPRRKHDMDAATLLSRRQAGEEQRETDNSWRKGLSPNGGNAPSAPVQREKTTTEWEHAPSSDGRSSNRSPVTTTSGHSGSSSKKPVALAVKREKQQRKQVMIDDSEDVKDGRKNLDKRTARLRFADAFKADILMHRTRFAHLNNATNHADKAGNVIEDRGVNGVSIAIRKRPIFDYEIDRGDYDIVSIDNTTESSHDVCIIHNCVMHADMRQMLMKPTRYPVSAAFDEHCSDDDIYRHVAEPLVKHASKDGISTILMYGQTGCGKSHTMTGIEVRMAHGLFQTMGSIRIDRSTRENLTVSVQFVELCGAKECNDLLGTSPAEVKLLDNDDGSVQLANATRLEIATPEALLDAINRAKGRRATEATDKNGVSSRSHAVCQIQIKGRKGVGVLTLIDCAGSERRHDSMYHSHERQKESAEINASLWALKECIRARANKSSRIPYRNSTLTRILRESLEKEAAKLCVIGCVAPNATDTEHTMETLKTVSTIVGIDDKITVERARPVMQPERQIKTRPLPKTYSHEQLKSFLEHKNMTIKLCDKHDGKTLMKMSIPQMRAQLFDDNASSDMAEKLFNLLRKETDFVTKQQRKDRVSLANERKGRKI